MKANTGIKKLFSLLLCCCMLLSMNSPAYATENVEPPQCTHGEATAPVAATCITPGNENVTCPVCEQPMDNEIPATGVHSYVDGKCTCGAEESKSAVCTMNNDCTLTEGHSEGCLKAASAVSDPICECDIKCTDENKNADCEVCGNTSDFTLCIGMEPVDTSDCTGLGSCQAENHIEKCLSLCICQELCTSMEYRNDCPVCKKGDGFNLCQICICVAHCTEANNGCNVCRVEHNACMGQCTKAEGCTAEKHDFNCPEAAVKEKVKPRFSYSKVSAEELKNIFGDLGLQSGLTYTTADTVDDAINGGYGDWEAEFYLSFGGFDGTISLNGCAVAGMIGPFKQHIPVDDDSMILSAGSRIAIIDSLKQLAGWTSFNVTYSLVCEFSDDGTMFVCGIKINEELLNKYPNFRVTLDLVLNPPAGVNEAPLLLHSENLNVSKLTGNGDIAAKIEGPDGTVEYDTFESALENASDNATISLMDALEYDTELKLENKTLNLNGYSFDGAVEGTVSVGGGTWNGMVCPENTENKSSFLFASDDGVFVSDGSNITSVTSGTVELLKETDAASIQFAKDVELIIAKDIALTVTGNVELGTSKISGDGKIVLMNAASLFRRLLKNTVLDSNSPTLTVDEKLPEGTVVSGVDGMAVTCSAEGGKYVYRLAPTVAKIGETPYASLQEAINNVKDGETIVLTDTITENVTVTQKAGVKFTIDGKGNTMAGSITVDGKSARYPTAGVTIKDINFNAESIKGDAFVNLGVSGNNNTRYTSNVAVQGCSFTGSGKVGIKSYTGGDTNLTVTGCTANAGTHSLVQVDNIEGKLIISGNKVYSKNGINLNSSANVEITGNDIRVSGYAVRTGATSGTGVTPTIVLSGNTLATDNSEGDAVIIVRKTTESANINMSNNSVSGDTHISGNTDATTISADANYWDGKDAPVVDGADVDVLSYYVDKERTQLAAGSAAVAEIGNTPYPSLQEALASVKDGETIKLLQDVELSSTLIIGDPNGAFNKIGININGNGQTIKAVGTGWDDNMWLVDVTYNAAISNLTFDGGNTGCKGVQFYTSNSSLTNVVIKNISADKWGYTDYALHSNASNVTLSGVSFVDCKHGHVIADMGSSTGRDETVVNATGSVSGATVILNTPEAKVTATQGGLTVLKGSDASVTDHVIVYSNGSYVLIVPVAQVGETLYESLDEAIAAAADGGTVKLLADAGNITVSENITLDPNGNAVGNITVAGGKTLTMAADDLPVTVKGSVKVGSNTFTLSDFAALSEDTSGNLVITPVDGCTVSLNGRAVELAGQNSMSIASNGTATFPAGSTVALSSEYAVYVASSGAQLDKNGKLTLMPAEATDMTGESFGYAVTIMTQIKDGTASNFAVLSPLDSEDGSPYMMTITLDSDGEPVYDCPDTKEAPIVDDEADGKDYLKFLRADKYFYKYGASRMYFTCNGFMDCLKSIKVDGKELSSRTDYILDRGSTIVTLRNGYLKELALGKHTLTLTYEDGQSISAEFTVGETPATGDSGYGVFAAGMGLSLMGLLAVLFILKKKRANG